MNAETKIIAATDLIAAVENDPGVGLVDANAFRAWLTDLKAKVDGLDTDVSRAKNRDAIKSAAAEIRRKKAGYDRERLAKTKEYRDLTAAVNAAGKEIETQLEALAIEVRRPVTEWEAAEAARIADCRSQIDNDIKAAGIVSLADTAESVRQRGMDVWAIVLDPAKFGEMLPEAQSAKDQTVATLKAELARLTQGEADRAELERLRAEAAARAEADRIAAEQAEAVRIKAARIEAERLAAEQAEQRRIADEQEAEQREIEAREREAARIEKARKDAAEAAQREAERVARAERDRIQAEHDAALAAEKKRADDLAAAKAEADRKAAEIEKQRIADEANKALQRRLKTEAKEAIMTCGTSEEVAQKIVLAIRQAKIPHVKWEV